MLLTLLDVNLERPLETTCLGSGAARFGFSSRPSAGNPLATPCRRDPGAHGTVRCQRTMRVGDVDAESWD